MNTERYDQAYFNSQKALKLIQQIVFKIMESNKKNDLINDNSFLNKLNLLFAIYSNLVY